MFTKRKIKRREVNKVMDSKSIFQQKRKDTKEIAKLIRKLTDEQKDTMFTVAMGYELLNSRINKRLTDKNVVTPDVN